MDPLLDARWRSGEEPFAFDCLRTEEILPIAKVRAALQVIVAELRKHFQSQPLTRLHDWHMHDGCVFPSRPSTWDDLQACLETNEALFAAGYLDDVVYLSFYPSSCRFLLRFNLDNEDQDEYPGEWGAFDVTAPAYVLDAISAALAPDVAQLLVREPSTHFFDRPFSGQFVRAPST